MKKVDFFIIAGTEKSGTTSVFSYLSNHPDIGCSLKKETDYFRMHGAEIDAQPSLEGYMEFFGDLKNKKFAMEASPGYLADSQYSAAAIAKVCPDARLLFMLRQPIERLISSFEFHKSRLYLPEDMHIDEYVDICIAHENGQLRNEHATIKEWFLRVPDAGKYAKHLQDFTKYFPEENIMIRAFEDLHNDAHGLMRDVCSFLKIDTSYFESFSFEKSNVTFSGKNKVLHNWALSVNRKLEPVFIKFPSVKRGLLSIYKTLNGKKVIKSCLGNTAKMQLKNYYASDIEALRKMTVAEKLPLDLWLKVFETQ